MRRKKIDVTVVRGDDLRVYVEVNDESGAPVAVSAAQSILYEVTRRVGEAPVITKSFGAGINLGGANEFFFDLTQPNTETLQPGRYRHEAQIVTSSGLRYTVFQGSLTILQKIIG